MSLLRLVFAEAWAIFIDDLGLAAGALLAAAVAAGLHEVGASDLACGALLFAGLVAALLISVWRRARSGA